MRNWMDHVMTLSILCFLVSALLLFYGWANERRNERLCQDNPSFAQSQKNVDLCTQLKARSAAMG
jgi:hypothetical protein